MIQHNEKNKQIGIAVAVVLLAVGMGFVLGRRPATVTDEKAAAQQESTSDAKTETAPAEKPSAAAPAGTTGTKTTTPTAGTGGEVIAPKAKAGTISLAAKSGNGGINFSWSTASNLTAPFGYVIFKSSKSTPSFPRDEAKFISDPNARSYSWDIQDGGTYWFKMCTWNGKATTASGCLTSSGVVKATAPTSAAAQQTNPFDYTATQLGLAGRTESDGIRLFWSQTTSSSFTSYKVVRSATDTNPYYPKTAAILTFTNKTDVGAFDTTAVKGAKYFYRVCAVRTGLNPECGNVWTVQY